MKNSSDGKTNSYLNRLLRDLKQTSSIRSGRESIDVEARDLFHAAYLAYIRDRWGDFQIGTDVLAARGIDSRKGIRVSENESGSHQLVVTFRDGAAQIPDLEQYFTDSNGVYNSKGYYDETTVERFNRTVYELLDQILGAGNES